MSIFKEGVSNSGEKPGFTGEIWKDIEDIQEYLRNNLIKLTKEEERDLAYGVRPDTDEATRELLKKLRVLYTKLETTNN